MHDGVANVLTAIGAVRADGGQATTYTVDGRRVAQPIHGISIAHGRKFMKS